jgi:hypothetical protein
MYAQLYKYTNDKHYLDVARVLLHAINPMVALPGRTYGMLGPARDCRNRGASILICSSS